MDLGRPHTALTTALDSAVLNVLAATTRPLTGREVARLAGRRSHAGVLEVLTRLTAHGLVDRQEAGRALLYTLNREHLAAPAVELLAGIRHELLERLRAAVAAWEIQPLHASVFGSAARGDGNVDSDVDVLVVRPAVMAEDDARWRDQLDGLAASIRRWTGNQAAIAELDQSALERLRGDEAPIAAELRADAIPISGPPIAELLA